MSVSAETYRVKAGAAKVSIGATGGNRVAVTLRRGAIVPAGVPQEQIDRLVKRGLLEAVEIPKAVEIPEGEPSEEWTGKQLDAYAASKNIDVSKAKSKAEKVAAIAAAQAE